VRRQLTEARARERGTREELARALERERAIGAVLRAINRSPASVEPVFDAILDHALRLCASPVGLLFLYDGDVFRLVAERGAPAAFTEPRRRGFRPGPHTGLARAVAERQPVQILDVLDDRAYAEADPTRLQTVELLGVRTGLWVPLLREGVPQGAFVIWRQEVRAFTPEQIDLLATFADQAVIALENARLFQALQARNRELTEALEQQTATAEILRVISSSPTDIQPVLNAVAESAARLCDSLDGSIFRVDENRLSLVAHHGPIPEAGRLTPKDAPLVRGTVGGRAVIERRTIQVVDLQAEAEEFPEGSARARQLGWRTQLSVPLLREGSAVGVISVRRVEARPFTDGQVKLLQTFADQAVIAIENVRLFQELETRNRELTEALQQQTATAEILRAISSSPTDVRPVFDAIASNAARLCESDELAVFRLDEGILRMVGNVGHGVRARTIGDTLAVTRGSVTGRAVLERRTIHIHDLLAESDEEWPEAKRVQQVVGHRTALAVPLMREGAVIGAIFTRRMAARPFTDRQVALLQTFAAQAVIAIENVRLFQELQARNRDLTDALEQQTATGEVLKVISGSPTDVQPVFETIVHSAVRLCGGLFGGLLRYDGELVHMAATVNFTPAGREAYQRFYPRPPSRETASGRAILNRTVIVIPDVDRDAERSPAAQQAARLTGFRSILCVPMLRDGNPIGAIVIGRAEPGSFVDKQIGLLQTFADQAVIAIENVRLLQELQARNRELTEALEQQTATAEILRVISSSPTEIGPVLRAVVENAARLCEAMDAHILLVQQGKLRLAATFGAMPSALTAEDAIPIDRDSVVGSALLDHRTVQVADILTVPPDELRLSQEFHRRVGHRSMLVTPLLREATAVGAIVIRRMEPGAFSDRQVRLLETFADQAVIAIENVRLFQELQARNRELTEALEQQTATAEVLQIISASPTDVQPVFDTIVQRAVRLCDGVFGAVYRTDGEILDMAAHANFTPEGLAAFGRVLPRPLDRSTPSGQAIVDGSVVHVPDVDAWPGPGVLAAARALGVRSQVSVPMLREGVAIGAIAVARREPGPFSDAQIGLLKTFADQAVIAVENVRLFGELRARTAELARSVEELRALGEVGQAVSSTLDLETVLTTITARADQLSGTDGGAIYEYDEADAVFRLRVTVKLEDELIGILRGTPTVLGEGVVGRAGVARAPVQIPDILQDEAYRGRLREIAERAGYRALLAVPLLREDRLIGALVVRRRVPGTFPPETVNLLQTFAAQSVLAIQNARLFRELEEKSRQLEVASRHKSQFLANMSHELRTPLNAILGYTELIQDRIYGEVPAKIREVMERVDKSGRHLLGLINDVLDLSKIEAGQLVLALNDYSLKEVVHAVVTAVEGLAAEKKLPLKVTVAPDLPRSRGDERRLTQVLLNLVGNAIKFTEAGEVRIDVRVAGDAFVVAVADTGPGIAPADQPRIFEEFQQADTSTTRKKGGTGLGLSIARRIIELHGGRISVESAPGQGATFTVTLPVRVERQAATP